MSLENIMCMFYIMCMNAKIVKQKKAEEVDDGEISIHNLRGVPEKTFFLGHLVIFII